MALGASKSVWQRLRSRVDAWAADHNGVVCTAIALAMAAALTGLAAFVALSDFGASATFIYNQF